MKMPTITIRTDKSTPNFCALEAVAMWMMDNYLTRNHLSEREIVVKSGRKIKVTELARKKGSSICSCRFKASLVGKNKGE